MPLLDVGGLIDDFLSRIRCYRGNSAGFDLGEHRPPPSQSSTATGKLNTYVGCVNSVSERAPDSRVRYFSWAPKSGPTGTELIVYGLYKISAAV